MSIHPYKKSLATRLLEVENKTYGKAHKCWVKEWKERSTDKGVRVRRDTEKTLQAVLLFIWMV